MHAYNWDTVQDSVLFVRRGCHVSHGNYTWSVTDRWLLSLRIRRESKGAAHGLDMMTCNLTANGRVAFTHHTGEDLGQSLHGSQGLGLPSSDTVLELVERLAHRVGVRDLRIVHERDVPDSPPLEDERRFTFMWLWSMHRQLPLGQVTLKSVLTDELVRPTCRSKILLCFWNKKCSSVRHGTAGRVSGHLLVPAVALHNTTEGNSIVVAVFFVVFSFGNTDCAYHRNQVILNRVFPQLEVSKTTHGGKKHLLVHLATT